MTQEKARNRNWAKARLLGFNLDSSVLTNEEKVEYNKARINLQILIANWI